MMMVNQQCMHSIHLRLTHIFNRVQTKILLGIAHQTYLIVMWWEIHLHHGVAPFEIGPCTLFTGIWDRLDTGSLAFACSIFCQKLRKACNFTCFHRAFTCNHTYEYITWTLADLIVIVTPHSWSYLYPDFWVQELHFAEHHHLDHPCAYCSLASYIFEVSQIWGNDYYNLFYHSSVKGYLDLCWSWDHDH